VGRSEGTAETIENEERRGQKEQIKFFLSKPIEPLQKTAGL
jgi:hypothetical protein